MLQLDSRAETPLYRQVYRQIRQDILSGILPEGVRLTPIRTLARELGVGKNTIENAYAQLAIEGYVVPVQGSGFVVNVMHQDVLPRNAPLPHAFHEAMRPAPEPLFRYDFHYGHVDPATFPESVWRKLTAEVLAGRGISPEDDIHSYGKICGDWDLRIELAKYVYKSRGVNCTPEQVVVVGGIQRALSALLRVFPYENKAIAMEDPGYDKARAVFHSNGFSVLPIPVQEDGIDLKALEASFAQAVFVTPSHQFPTGAVMPIQKRIDLLYWASETGNLIIEDDYDSEFRYNGRPIPSLQSIDRQGRSVVYFGTFSKALSAGLRLGYMVLPQWLLHDFMEAYAGYRCPVSLVEQRILARFMAEGHWEKHVRKMCQLNKKKHDTLVDAVKSRMGSMVRVRGHNAALHILLEFPFGGNEGDLIAKAARAGVKVDPISPYRVRKGEEFPPTVLLGYGLIALADIPKGVARLAEAWFG